MSVSITLDDGETLNVGDRFRENDNRFDRIVRITGFDLTKNPVKVQLNGRTWAKCTRFNGKHGGYIKVTEPAPTCPHCGK